MVRDVLASWEIDRSFIDRLLRRSEAFELVSLDIFDTALTRCLDSPVDVFALVEQRLIERYGACATGFALAREDAEAEARTHHFRAHNAQEVTLAQIYTSLSRFWKSRDLNDEALAVELQTEIDVLCAVPDIVDLVRQLRHIEKPFIFVSDMYLPSSVLADALRRNGIDGWQGIFVSNELGTTKASGHIWDKINPDKKKIIHIGDDYRSDYELPRSHGIETEYYTRAKSARRTGAKLQPSILPFSRAQRFTDLAGRASVSRINAVTTTGESARAVGEVFGTIVVGTFIKWLAERLTQFRVSDVYFCARDGWLIQRAWRAAGLDYTTKVKDHYFYISRRPLNMALGYIESSPSQLSDGLLSFLASSDGTISVERALKRADLDRLIPLVDDARKEFGSLDTLLDWRVNVHTFRDLLQRHSALIHPTLKTSYQSLEGYMQQEGITESVRPAMVDLGWHGTLQRSLRRIGKNMSPGFELYGFYYGLWTEALRNRYAAGFMQSLFANEFMSLNDFAEVHGGVEILEELHSAPHGSVASYHLHEGAWRASYALNHAEAKQYEDITSHFQAGTIEGISQIFRTGRFRGLSVDDLTCENARAAMGSVILSPSQSELAVLMQLGHCSTSDHQILEPLVDPAMPADGSARLQALGKMGWRVGTLRGWHLAEANRPIVRALAEEHLSHLGHRTLRQFQ